jgi:hypothetical protein
MKTLLVFLIAAMTMMACKQRETRSAGEQTVNPVEDSANFTTIQWIDSTYKDLGTVKEGPEVEVTYKFRNTGDKALVIADVQASCGCTVPEKPKEPFAPGEEGTIRAKFTTSGHLNVNNKTITVVANTKGTTSHLLSFHIVVEK